jgi:hypothetical protein
MQAAAAVACMLTRKKVKCLLLLAAVTAFCLPQLRMTPQTLL